MPGYEPLFHLAEGGMGTVQLAVRREGAFRRLCGVKRPHLAQLITQEARSACSEVGMSQR